MPGAVHTVTLISASSYKFKLVQDNMSANRPLPYGAQPLHGHPLQLSHRRLPHGQVAWRHLEQELHFHASRASV